MEKSSPAGDNHGAANAGTRRKGYGWPKMGIAIMGILLGALAADDTNGKGWRLSSAAGIESSKSCAILLRNSRREMLMQGLHGEQKPLSISWALSLSAHEERDRAPCFGIEGLLSSWPSMQLHSTRLSHPILFLGISHYIRHWRCMHIMLGKLRVLKRERWSWKTPPKVIKHHTSETFTKHFCLMFQLFPTKIKLFSFLSWRRKIILEKIFLSY